MTKRSDSQISSRVVRQVAESANREIDQLPPLFESIDPDAFNRLCDTAIASESDLKITFEYASYEVTVETDSCVDIDVEEQYH